MFTYVTINKDSCTNSYVIRLIHMYNAKCWQDENKNEDGRMKQLMENQDDDGRDEGEDDRMKVRMAG